MSDNTVTVIGNLARDPELRFTANGQAVTNFGMAVNRKWQNRQTQEWEEQTSWFDVTCWQQLAENVAETLGKGARVIVTGRLDQRSWENQDGEKRSKIEITADDVGPSLKWASAVVSRNERKEAGASDNGSSRAAPSRSSSRSTARSSRPEPADYEEPF